MGHKDGGILIGKVSGHPTEERRKTQAVRMNFGPAVLPLPTAPAPASAFGVVVERGVDEDKARQKVVKIQTQMTFCGGFAATVVGSPDKQAMGWLVVASTT